MTWRRSSQPEEFSSSTGQLFDPVGVGCPIGVIAHGHDHVYPAINKTLFREVVSHGVLVSEHPIGIKPFAHYFPQRNAVVAGLAALVIVVESADGGGSMITARIAHGEGIDVLAVPGSVFSNASAGCNHLINDGAAICRSAQDVIDTLNGVPRHQRGVSTVVVDRRRVPGPEAARVLQAMAWDVLAVETLLVRCPEFTPGRLLLVLHELEFDEWVARGSDGWFQRAPI
jgi:predicted Rossmann fold nucleotide-binding protein DprA/Smf involved in DNA uptake